MPDFAAFDRGFLGAAFFAASLDFSAILCGLCGVVRNVRTTCWNLGSFVGSDLGMSNSTPFLKIEQGIDPEILKAIGLLLVVASTIEHALTFQLPYFASHRSK
jgi:hypothetical protein